MDNTAFTNLAEQTIAFLADIIEAQDKECLIEIDFQSDILTLTTNEGIFVINKHSAAKEIWLSSPISGPHHFCYTHSRWQSKANKDLLLILEEELKINFNNLNSG